MCVCVCVCVCVRGRGRGHWVLLLFRPYLPGKWNDAMDNAPDCCTISGAGLHFTNDFGVKFPLKLVTLLQIWREV